MPKRAESKSAIPELNGVRGIAILLVLLYHFQGPRPASLPRILYAPLALGWSGVDLFFVLSGFLISGILLDTNSSVNYFSSFYARRALRIFPLYLITIFAYFDIALPLAHHFGYWRSWNGSLQIWYWLHLSNWHSAYGNDVLLLGHLWSLSIEEQFYFIWPVVILLVRPSRLTYLCSITILVALGLRIAYLHSSFGYEFLHRLTPFRVDSLAVGCLIALLVRNKNWLRIIETQFRLITFMAVSMLMFVLLFSAKARNSAEAPLMITMGYTSLAFVYGCLVFFAYRNTGSSMWLATRLRSGFLTIFGKYSYAIYVIHFPIAVYQREFFARIAERSSESTTLGLWVLSPLLGVLVSFGLAQLSWHLLEKHFLKLKKRFVARF